MGADLYINSIYEPQHEKIEPLFNQAVALRNSLPEGSAERQSAQAKVQGYADQLYAVGYFRDPYNNWDLLWQFGLSWWKDVEPRLDRKGNLAPSDTAWLLRKLQSREQRFAKATRDLPAEDQEYFRERYEAFRGFLNSGIERNESIFCSV